MTPGLWWASEALNPGAGPQLTTASRCHEPWAPFLCGQKVFTAYVRHSLHMHPSTGPDLCQPGCGSPLELPADRK